MHESTEKVNTLEQYSRRNNIRIFGLKESQSERHSDNNNNKNISDFLQRRLGLRNINENQIDKAHRVGRYSPNHDRAFVVRFVKHDTARLVLQKRRALKGTGITITEDLTKTNAIRLHKLKNLGNASQAWSQNGDLFVKDKHGIVHKYNNNVPLQELNERMLNANHRPTTQSAKGVGRGTHTIESSRINDTERTPPVSNETKLVTTISMPSSDDLISALNSTPKNSALTSRSMQALSNTPDITPVQKRIMNLADNETKSVTEENTS